jgi:hypothetical protein
MKIAGVEIITAHPGGLRTPVEQRPLLFRTIALRGVTARNRIMCPERCRTAAANCASVKPPGLVDSVTTASAT